MTSKEKAKQLFEKFRTLASDETIEQRERTAKICCNITITELIECSESYDRYNATWASQVKYWQEVLTEVEGF